LDAAGLADNAVLTLKGSAAENVINLVGDIDAHLMNGALTVTTGNATDVSITTGNGSNTITATALTAGHTLNLFGSHAATVTLNAGNLSAGTYTGDITVTGGAAGNTITTGSGNDTITGAAGA